MLRHVVFSLVRGSSQSAIRQAGNAGARSHLFKRAVPSFYATASPIARLASFHNTACAREAEVIEEEDSTVKPKRKKRTPSASTKKVAKPKKAKQPAKPKRILHPPKLINNSWVLYFKERLDAMPKEEKVKVSELSKALVADFRNLSASERASLDERLVQHKQNFEREMKEYMEKVTPEMIQEENRYRRMQKKKTTKRTRKYTLLRDPTKPQLPLNGFFRFANRVRTDSSLAEEVVGTPDANSLGFTESAKKIAEKWKSMSEADKEPYQSEWQKEKEVYDRELAEWKAKQTPAV